MKTNKYETKSTNFHTPLLTNLFRLNTVIKSKMSLILHLVLLFVFFSPKILWAQQTSIFQGLEIPKCSTKATDHQIRQFDYYTICYRESYEQCEWSAYKLTKDMLVKNTDRSNDFKPDPAIKTKSADLNDYKGSGFDRGHLTPAADMAFDKKAMSETFYMSNMSPQFPAFNRGIWMHLENQVRKWVKNYGTAYIVSGPVFDKEAGSYETIGANKVSIPQYYYKTILITTFQGNTPSVKAIGFIIPNTKCDDTFMNYAVTIDEIERRTGLDFYSLLDDSIEDKIESSFYLDDWK